MENRTLRGISRNFAEFRGISRNFFFGFLDIFGLCAEFRGIFFEKIPRNSAQPRNSAKFREFGEFCCFFHFFCAEFRGISPKKNKVRGISRNFFRDAAKFRAKSEIPRKKQKKEKFEFYAYLKSHSQKNIFLNIFWFHLNRHFFQKSKKINIFLMENFLGLFARIFEKNRSSPRAKRRVFCPRRAKRSAKNFLYPLLPTASKNYFRIGIFSKSEKKLIF